MVDGQTQNHGNTLGKTWAFISSKEIKIIEDGYERELIEDNRTAYELFTCMLYIRRGLGFGFFGPEKM